MSGQMTDSDDASGEQFDEYTEMEQAATEAVPEDVEAAVFEAPEPDAYPAVAGYAFVAGAAGAAGSNVGDAATDAVLDAASSVLSAPQLAEESDVDVSKHASAEELLAHHEHNN